MSNEVLALFALLALDVVLSLIVIRLSISNHKLRSRIRPPANDTAQMRHPRMNGPYGNE